ncbi:MAG: hypothetical protein U9N45_00165, partial [Gemmatimonadota bacterium]|nr:hypothetical protein [Gemmatimonadota bacterium]
MKVILLTIILSCSSVGLTALKAAISEQVPAESSVEAPRPEGTGQDQVRQAKAGPEKDTAALDSLAVMDSLATAADSLARAVDSLETLLDSIVHSKEKAEKEARAKAAEKKRKVKKRLWNGTLGMGLTQNRGNDSQSSFITT